MTGLEKHTGFVPQLKPKQETGSLFTSLNIGRFVYVTDYQKILFQDSRQKLHPLKKISFVTPEWNTEDGEKNLPKPYIIDKNNQVSGYGDNVLYGFTEQSPDNNIIIIGSIFNLELGMFDKALNTDVADPKSWKQKNLVRNNQQRYFSVQEDGTGNLILYLEGKKKTEKEEGEDGTGNFVVKVKGTEENGLVKFETNGKIVINQTQIEGDEERITAQVVFDNTKDAESITIRDKLKNKIIINKDGVSLETEGATTIKTKKEVKIESEDKVSLLAKKDVIVDANGNLEANIKGNAKINSPSVKVTGGQLEVAGTTAPEGSGGFCALPNCVFSGAPHTGTKVIGT